MKQKYDIFISYRRLDTGDKAEHLKDLLDKEGYKNRISFDRENLTGLFDVALAKRIDNCKDFLSVIGKNSLNYSEDDFSEEKIELYNYLGKCSQQEFKQKIEELGPNAPIDFVRIEIARALNREDLNIIPIVPESSSDFKFASLNLPSDIVNIKRYEAVFYSANPDALFKDIIPKVKVRLISRPNTLWKKLLTIFTIIALVGIIGYGYSFIKDRNNEQKIKAIKENIYQTDIITDLGNSQPIIISENLSLIEIETIYDILSNMGKVEGGTFKMGAAPNSDGTYNEDVYLEWETPQKDVSVSTFWMSRYEVSIGEWNRIMGRAFNPDSSLFPISNVSYDDCCQFIEKLKDHTNLEFSLPTEAEWEYAARGGNNPDSTLYSGKDNPNEVAWYTKNSNGRVHVRNDKDGGLYPNNLDLYDMSGNVCEWCLDDFEPYDTTITNLYPGLKPIRGGYYDSDSNDITVYQRDIMNPIEKSDAVGFRLIIKTNL